MNINKFLSNYQALNNKTFLITGASGGIGKYVVKHLASIHAHIICANRSEAKTLDLKNEILKVHPDAKIDFIPLDLCNTESVKNFILKVKTLKLDYFFHNAGIYNVKRQTTDLGFDNIYQTNCLMPFYITQKLLETFKTNNTKLLYMGSIAYNYSKINKNDIQFLNCKKINHIYGNSKRVAMFAMTELMKQNRDIEFSIVHPGLTLTNMTNHYHKAINWLVKIGLKIVCPPPAKASLPVIYATTHHTDYSEWIGPKTFNIWGKPKAKRFKIIEDEAKFAYATLLKQTENISI